MSIAVSISHLQGKERKEIIETVQRQAKKAAVEAIQPLLTQFLEAEVEIKLGRKKGANRQISSQKREIDWTCGYCGCQDANQFMRDGHYKRSLETGWGHIQGLRVSMLECQRCHRDVICRFSILEKYSRFWLDLDQDVLFSSGLGQSLRVISQRWSEQVGGNVGLRTIVFPDQPDRTVHRAHACQCLSHLSQRGSTRWHLGHDAERGERRSSRTSESGEESSAAAKRS